MNDVVQAVVGTDLVERHAAQRPGLGIEAVGGEETVAHAYPDCLVGEDALEMAPFERVEQRDRGRKEYHRHRHLEAADAKLLTCEHFAVAVEHREAY
jgi:hypothetical protein